MCSEQQAQDLVKCCECDQTLFGLGFSQAQYKLRNKETSECRDCKDAELWEELLTSPRYLKAAVDFYTSNSSPLAQIIVSWHQAHMPSSFPGSSSTLKNVYDALGASSVLDGRMELTHVAPMQDIEIGSASSRDDSSEADSYVQGLLTRPQSVVACGNEPSAAPRIKTLSVHFLEETVGR
jgi:hypothetical protein